MFGFPVQGSFAIVVLITMSFNANIVQLAALPLSFISMPLYRWISGWMFGILGDILVFFCEVSSPVKFVFYGDVIQSRKDENAIIISNHYGAEWCFFACIARRQGMVYATRYIQKEMLKWVPVNWAAYLHDHLFIKRGARTTDPAVRAKNREATRTQIRDKVASFMQYKTPFWLVLFPEGTWIAGKKEQHVVDYSHEFAKKLGRTPYDTVLNPRVGAYEACMSAAEREHCVLYDVTIAYPNYPATLGVANPPNTFVYLNGIGDAFPTAPKVVHVHVRRLQVDTAHAQGEEAAAEFLWDAYDRKERMLKSFEKNGYTFEGEEAQPVTPQPRLPHMCFSLAFSCACILLQFWLIAMWSVRVFAVYFATVFALSVFAGHTLTDSSTLESGGGVQPFSPRAEKKKSS